MDGNEERRGFIDFQLGLEADFSAHLHFVFVRSATVGRIVFSVVYLLFFVVDSRYLIASIYSSLHYSVHSNQFAATGHKRLL